MTTEKHPRNKPRESSEIHKVTVLLYHRIVKQTIKDDWANIAVQETVFQRQMELLDYWGYTAITLEDFNLYQEGKLDLPKKPVIITFDDAYEEIHSLVRPILQRYGMRAVVFVVGDPSIRESVWDKNLGTVFKLLSEKQIIELKQDGFEIGSHSMTHPDLTHISKEGVWQELLRSRMLLEILLNSPVRSFAYPYGLLNEGVKKMVAEAGYVFACAAFTGPPVFGKDLYEIRRIKVYNTNNPLLFRFLLHPWYSFLRWLYWRSKQLLTGAGKNTGDPDPSKVFSMPAQTEEQK